MTSPSYELGVGHVSIIPSFKDLSKHLSKSLDKALPSIEKSINSKTGSAFQKVLKNTSNGINNLSFNKVGANFSSGFVNQAISGIKKVGSSLSETIGSSAKVAAGIAGTAIGSLGAVAVGGGFSRALSENNALAKLQAFGYEAQQIESIMKSVNSVIDGTSFTKPETLAVTTQLLASGAKEGRQLEEVLKQTGKLADMSGVSFSEMGDILAKTFAGGIVYTEDINQLAGRGIAIWQALADHMGGSVDSVRDSLSKGQVSFEDLQGAINRLTFDSALFASQDATSAFNNFFTSIKKVGQAYWEPLINNSATFFNTLKGGVTDLQNNPSYKRFLESAQQKLENLAKGAQTLAEGIRKYLGNVNFDKILNQISVIYGQLKGFEPLIVGLGAVLASGLLSKIPIIGSLFGGITLPVGLLLGLVGTLALKFEEFGSLMKTIGSSIQDFFTGVFSSLGQLDKLDGKGIQNFLNQINNYLLNVDFQKIGENFGSGISSIFNFITSAFSGANETLRPLGESLGRFIEKLAEVFSSTSGSLKGENIGETLVNILSGLVNGITAILPAVSSLISGIASFVTSDTFTAVINGLISVASMILSNEVLLTSFIGVLAGIFVGSKIAAFLQGFGLFSKSSKSFSGFFNVIKSALTSLSTLTAPIVAALPTIGLISLLIIGIGGLLVLLEKMGTFEVIGGIIDFMLEKLGQGLILMATLFDLILKSVGGFLGQLGDILIKAAPIVSEAIVNLVNALGDNFVKVVSTLETFMVNLALFGGSSLLGATAFASGLALIAGSLALFAGGSALSGLSDMVTGKDGSSLETLTSLVTALSTFSTEMNKLPETINQVLPGALSSGLLIGQNLQIGLFQGFNFPQVKQEMRNLISELQVELNQNPLVIKVDDSNLREYARSGGSGGYSGTSRTTNSNQVFNITANNANTIRELIKAGR